LTEDFKGSVIEKPSTELEKCPENSGLAASMQID
jgi:hypothetical protein